MSTPETLSPVHEMARDRTRLAYERTQLAWVRTAASLISFGFTIFKFFDFLDDQRSQVPDRLLGPREFAVVMISVGLLALVLSTIEHRRHLQDLRRRFGPLPLSMAAILSCSSRCSGCRPARRAARLVAPKREPLVTSRPAAARTQPRG